MYVYVNVRVSLAGFAYGSVYFLPLSRKLDTAPFALTILPPLYSLTAVERLHFPLGKISGFNFRACVCMYDIESIGARKRER